jgi:hypothetical protein
MSDIPPSLRAEVEHRAAGRFLDGRGGIIGGMGRCHPGPQFRVGDRVTHKDHPKWGIGVVVEIRQHAEYQTATVEWPYGGRAEFRSIFQKLHPAPTEAQARPSQ